MKDSCFSLQTVLAWRTSAKEKEKQIPAEKEMLGSEMGMLPLLLFFMPNRTSLKFCDNSKNTKKIQKPIAIQKTVCYNAVVTKTIVAHEVAARSAV